MGHLLVETCLLGFPAVQEDRGAAGRNRNHTCSLGVPGSLSYYVSRKMWSSNKKCTCNIRWVVLAPYNKSTIHHKNILFPEYI